MANLQSKTNIWNNLELRKRIMFLLGALIVFRIGAHIPVPGVDAVALAKQLFRNQGGGILSMLNIFSGGSLERFSIFAIGIMPYVSASIIIQLASEIFPSLRALKKEGDAGRKTITKYTRFGAVVLATVQGAAASAFVYQQGVVAISPFQFYISALFGLVGGTMFLMWLGEQITERGIGNGISLLITAGIVAGIPSGIGQLLALINNKTIGGPTAFALILGVVFLIYVVVFFESAQRKVPVQYAKRQMGGKLIQGQSTHIPFKLNMAGVIPPIFASSIIMVPTMLLSWFGSRNYNNWFIQFIANGFAKLAGLLQRGQLTYDLLFAITIIFFCYFYTALAFSPKEMAENLKKSGAFIPSIRPGANTAKYLEQIVIRLTLFGALYITIICLIPEFLTNVLGIQVALGGTSLLIMVVVIMDFSTQIGSYQMTQQYSKLVKRSDIKSLPRG